MSANLQNLVQIYARAFPQERGWSAAEFAALIRTPSSVLICEHGGYVLARVVMEEFEIISMAVDPDIQRRGVGRGMLSELDQIARTRGATRGHLEVAADNKPAIALYHSCGYRESGRRTGYYRRKDSQPVDALNMSKSLDAR